MTRRLRSKGKRRTKREIADIVAALDYLGSRGWVIAAPTPAAPATPTDPTSKERTADDD